MLDMATMHIYTLKPAHWMLGLATWFDDDIPISRVSLQNLKMNGNKPID